MNLPLMILDDPGGNGPAGLVARRLEAEALLDQLAGRLIELFIPARMGDRAMARAAVPLDGVNARDGPPGPGRAGGTRIVPVPDLAADLLWRRLAAPAAPARAVAGA